MKYFCRLKICALLLMLMCFCFTPIFGQTTKLNLTINGYVMENVIFAQNGISYLNEELLENIYDFNNTVNNSSTVVYEKTLIPNETITLKIDRTKKNEISINGNSIHAYATYINNALYIPFKPIATYFNEQFTWDSTNNSLILNSYYTDTLKQQSISLLGIELPRYCLDSYWLLPQDAALPHMEYSSADNLLSTSIYVDEVGYLQIKKLASLFVSNPEEAATLSSEMWDGECRLFSLEYNNFQFLWYHTSDGMIGITISPSL